MSANVDYKKGQLCFLVDATRCINCKTCEIACKDINDAVVGQRIRHVHTYEGGEYPHPIVTNISMSCNHCEEPKCVTACPVGAYSKREQDGIVVHNVNLCIGCKYCTWACPYGAPQYDSNAGKIKKCNMCVELMEKGEKPVCVQACPVRAIEVVRFDEISTRSDVTIAVRNLPSQDISKPTPRYKVKWEMRLD